ncbi:choline dehydrogenase, mitochondrial-like [Folsomia candida]|uniref:choline dehydrogenase, mitochondrial-like n=1 Tax=Folsomia candida TaxID=158441 RepID=UPI0016051DA5|nr:choline dehydrogenase, mitochondrial-like [Folsomia candida]
MSGSTPSLMMSVLRNLNPMRAWGGALALGPLAFTLVGMLGPMLELFMSMDRNYDRMMMRVEDGRDLFDFIIVGGGSTGCVLASKLSEKYSVLLLEYGGAPTILQHIPIYTFYLYNEPSIDWAHYTVPQKHASHGLIDNSVLFPTGKLLGGSSQLNAMMYIRGNVQGFDEIANKTGDGRWATKNILNYYRDMEDYNGWFPSYDHGRGGKMSVERPNLARFTKYLMKAGEELGIKIRDPNPYGPYVDGISMMDLYMKNGRRSDAYTEFLAPIMGERGSLVVRKYAFVHRVLFEEGANGHLNIARGVEYERHGKKFRAWAKKEVILSAGSLNSAKLLMLSGVGPWGHLQSVGIKPRVDLPVGQYLQDKYGCIIGPFIVDKGAAIRYDRDISVGNIIDWWAGGRSNDGGAFRSSLAEGTWAITTKSAVESGRTTAPNIHAYILSMAVSKELESGASKSFNIKPEVARFMSMTKGKDSFLQLVTLNKPLGYGNILLRDANPYSPLLIDPRYLEDPRDFEGLVEGIKFAVELVERTHAFSKVRGHLMRRPIPGCQEINFMSDEYFRCLARQITVTAYKYSGTAPIGRHPSEDPWAVVDSHLRVYGTRGLRVIDGSVLQQKHVSINDVTCRMLGHVAADIVKQDWF